MSPESAALRQWTQVTSSLVNRNSLGSAVFEHPFPAFNQPIQLNIDRKLTETMIYSGSYFFWECRKLANILLGHRFLISFSLDVFLYLNMYFSSSWFSPGWIMSGLHTEATPILCGVMLLAGLWQWLWLAESSSPCLECSSPWMAVLQRWVVYKMIFNNRPRKPSQPLSIYEKQGLIHSANNF